MIGSLVEGQDGKGELGFRRRLTNDIHSYIPKVPTYLIEGACLSLFNDRSCALLYYSMEDSRVEETDQCAICNLPPS